MQTARFIATAAFISSFALPQLASASLITTIELHPGANSPDSPIYLYESTYASASHTSNFGDSSYSASGEAIAGYGVLKAYASLSLTNYLPNSFHSEGCGGGCYIADPVYVTATFGESLIITGGTGTGYLFMDFDIDGTVTQAGNLGVFSTVQGALAVYGNSSLVLNTGFRSGPLTLGTSAIPFTYGTPFDVTVQLAAFSVAWDTLDTTNGDPYDFSGTADYLNTVILNNLSIYSDMAGTRLASGFVTANSGTNYAVVSAPVSEAPEPAALGLLALGLTALGLRSRRRRA